MERSLSSGHSFEGLNPDKWMEWNKSFNFEFAIEEHEKDEV